MPFDTMKELVLSGVYAMKEGADAPVGLSAPTAAYSCVGAAVAPRPLKTMHCIVLLTRLRVQQRMGEAQNKNGC